jgi:hypothetical protein
MKVTREEIAAILEMDLTDDPTKITATRTGIITVRKEYYWRPKKSPEESFAPQLQKLQAAGLTLEKVEYGDKFASFKGAEGVAKNSHYWMKFSASKVETPA